METYIAILRGINVSGQKKIPMQELKALLTTLHYQNITTYIQSGNVVFAYNKTNPDILSKQIEEAIFKKYNFQVPVLIKTGAELQAIIDHNPLIKEKEISVDKLHVTLLAEKPPQTHVDKTNTYHYEPDRFVIVDKQVYIFCPDGYGRTKLTNTFFENKLKVTATTRNWKTINELVKMAASFNA